MANQPYIPRKSAMTGTDRLVTHDWDASFFQPLVQAVDTLTPAGTFATNAAAVAGGLLVGQVYQTAAGEVRVVV
jgi:hypothetical protein